MGTGIMIKIQGGAFLAVQGKALGRRTGLLTTSRERAANSHETRTDNVAPVCAVTCPCPCLGCMPLLMGLGPAQAQLE